MRIMLAAVCFTFSVGLAEAQVSNSGNTDKSTDSTGRTVTPETKGQLQPQGWTGPTETTTGGAPAGSPQGQSPPGMQAAPEGSSKTVVEPKK
jgi:hypothetical protein